NDGLEDLLVYKWGYPQVLEELEIAPLVDQQILESVVVVVAPDGAHRDALARSVQIADAGRPRDVHECAVAAIHIQRVGVAEPAVRQVQIGPAVIVHIGDRDGRPQRPDERGDVVELRVEGWAVVHEGDAHLRCHVREMKAGVGRDIAGAAGAGVQHQHERYACDEQDADEAVAPREAGGGHRALGTTSNAPSTPPTELPPTNTRNRPGSTANRMSRQ